MNVNLPWIIKKRIQVPLIRVSRLVDYQAKGKFHHVSFADGKTFTISPHVLQSLIEIQILNYPHMRMNIAEMLSRAGNSNAVISCRELLQRMVVDSTAAQRPKDQSSVPPRLGEKVLLLILPKKDRECMLGDLQEEYAEHQAKYGTRFAKLWYYKQVIGSAWPMIKKAFRWGIIAWIGDLIRRHI